MNLRFRPEHHLQARNVYSIRTTPPASPLYSRLTVNLAAPTQYTPPTDPQSKTPASPTACCPAPHSDTRSPRPGIAHTTHRYHRPRCASWSSRPDAGPRLQTNAAAPRPGRRWRSAPDRRRGNRVRSPGWPSRSEWRLRRHGPVPGARRSGSGSKQACAWSSSST
jgi:hypothetical protein